MVSLHPSQIKIEFILVFSKDMHDRLCCYDLGYIVQDECFKYQKYCQRLLHSNKIKQEPKCFIASVLNSNKL